MVEAIIILTPAGAARVVGRTPRRVRQWGEPKIGDPARDRHISFADALALDVACIAAAGQAPFTARWIARIAAAGTRDAGGDPLVRLTAVTAEVGDIARALGDARAPDGPGGRATLPAEAAELFKHATELRLELDRLVAAVGADVLGGERKDGDEA